MSDINTINRALNRGLGFLQATNAHSERADKIIREMNATLFGIIETHPELANSVRISSRIRIKEGERTRLREYLESVKGRKIDRGTFDYNFVQPLPYDDGRFLDGRSIYESAKFVCRGRRKVPWFLDISLESTYGPTFSGASLQIGEVEDIELAWVDDSAFSALDVLKGNIVPQYSSLHHYLLYRGFRKEVFKKGGLEKHIPENILQKKVYATGGTVSSVARDILVHPKLTVVRENVSGFAGLFQDYGGGHYSEALYKFNGVSLPQEVSTKTPAIGSAVAVAYALTSGQSRNFFPHEIEHYTGREAITRLKQA